jgi:magnesium-transporting ATPase (P-type)
MKSIKCPNCGLISFLTQTICNRCQTQFKFSDSTQNTNYGNEQGNENPMAITRKQETGFGVFLLSGGAFIFVMNWMSAIYSNHFYTSATFLGPVAFAVGLCFITIPFPQKEHFPKAEYAPRSWAFLIIPSIIISILNWLYFMGII